MMDTSERVIRKVWPEALKREIVAAASAPGASVSVVARQYDVNANLVFTWRRLYGKASDASPPASQFLPVMVTADRPAAGPPGPSADMIEIELPGGYRVRCGRGVKGASLRVVLDALERR
jgi:transposase